MSRMLYSYPGKEIPNNKIHGDYFNHIVVDEDEVEAYQEKGWFLTTAEAKEKAGISKKSKQQADIKLLKEESKQEKDIEIHPPSKRGRKTNKD